MESHNVRWVDGLDHLRGFGAFLVLFHHSYWICRGIREPPMMTWDAWQTTDNPLWSIFIESHLAVGLFFIVSGFVFTLAAAGREMSYLKYLRNRLLRVFPVLLFVLLFGLALFPARYSLSGVISSLTLFADLLPFTREMDLHPVTTAFWTVGVEFQFYVLFPFLAAIMNREGVRPLVFLVLFMIALRTAGFVLGDSVRDLVYWHLVPGRLDQFLIGMLGARFWLRWREDPRVARLGPSPWSDRLAAQWRRGGAFWVVPGTVVLFAWTFTVNRAGGYPAQAWWRIFTPTTEALVCLVFALGYLACVHRVPARIGRVFAFLGDLSFSTYMCHFFVVAIVAGDVTGQSLHGGGILFDWSRVFPGIGAHGDAVLNTLLLTYPISILLSYLCFNAVEGPFMRLRTRYVREASEGTA